MSDKKVRTVLGDISPSEVGITLTHEHLSTDVTEIFFLQPEERDKGKELLPFVMENLGWIRQYPNSHKENLAISDVHDTVIDELHYFKKNGGSLIVDNTNHGLKRDVTWLKEASKATGVHIVAGAGYYVQAAHPPELAGRSQESLVEEMVKEVTEGCENTGIKCGIIGEIGCSWPLHADEKKVLLAAAAAQHQLGCPVVIQSGRNEKAPFESVRIYQEAGGDISKTVVNHLDRTLRDLGQMADFAALGSYCAYDYFGLETSHYQYDLSMDMPTDAQRIRYIKHLVDEGFEDRIVVSHDVYSRHRLMKYGGHGLSHIMLNVVPKMKQRGLSDVVINKILAENESSGYSSR